MLEPKDKMVAKMKSIYQVIIFIICITSFSTDIFAQVKYGTTAASFLEIGVGSAGVGMGSAYTAIAEDVSAIYWNPAKVASLKRFETMFVHQPWLVGISYKFMGAVLPIQNIGAIGLGITVVNSGDMEETTMDYQEGTGAYFNTTDMAISLTFARQITNRFSFGFSGKYISQRISTMEASALALDFGVHVVTPFFERSGSNISGIQIGMSITNYGQKMRLVGDDTFMAIDQDLLNSGNNDKIPADIRMEEYNLPVTFRIGLAYDMLKTENHRLTLATDAVHPNNYYEVVNTGAQYKVSIGTKFEFDFRGGYKALFAEDSVDGLSLGFGVKLKYSGFNLGVDYSYSEMGVLGNINTYTVSIGL